MAKRALAHNQIAARIVARCIAAGRAYARKVCVYLDLHELPDVTDSLLKEGGEARVVLRASLLIVQGTKISGVIIVGGDGDALDTCILDASQMRHCSMLLLS